jgi:PAS domain S-box-containing protein
MSLGRIFLLWLLGVLVLTIVTVSALVLWHEQRVLSDELRAHGELLARLLALTAVDGGSSEHLALLSLTDLAAGEVRGSDGQVLWRYGPSVDEVLALGDPVLEVRREVTVTDSPLSRDHTVEVTVLLSRARIQGALAGAAVRLIIALGFALAIAMSVGLWLVSRVVDPLNELAEASRRFNPEAPADLGATGRGAAELVELATAFQIMTRRLSDQQRVLAASERRSRELFSSSPTPLLELDPELNILGANPAAVTFLGVEPETAIGRPLEHWVVGSSGDPSAVSAAVSATRADAMVETRWRLPDGDLAEVELHFRPTGDDEIGSWIASIHDLTDRVRRMGERWRRTFDAMIDGVALVDGSGSVMVANRALAPHLPVVANQLVERAETGGGWRTRSLDRLLECNLSRPRGLSHAILVVRDITDSHHAEARLREAEKMEAVATLASGVAHDFNNLLAAILLHVRWLEGEPERAREAAAAIRDLAEQGSEVVGELLLFARSDDSLPPRTFDLVELVKHLTPVLNHLLPDGVSLVLDLADRTIPILGNPVALRRLVLNLVVNARDAVAGTGGEVTVVVAHRGGRAVIEVVDTGPGIDEDHRDRLFEPFFTLRRRGRGAGLGLAVVYAITSAHGGDVEVVSAAGEGARFVVRLPPGDPAELEPLDDGEDRSSSARPRVLLIEDDGRAAVRLVEAMAVAGYEVRHAPDAEIADRLTARWAPEAVVVGAGSRAARDWSGGRGVPRIVIDDPSAIAADDLVVARLAGLGMRGGT